MQLKCLSFDLSVCKLADAAALSPAADFYFIGKTDEELSVVCKTAQAPAHTIARDDGWRALRIEGVLDFSLIGILARLSQVLAEAGVGIFAISTYNTDYILVKAENLDRALRALTAAGYTIT